jgi:hypothetical protein
MKIKKNTFDGKRLPFVHAQYVSMDSKWSAVGSWNVWTQVAFFEIELETFIQSESIARELEEIFEEEKTTLSVRIATRNDCVLFLPAGCTICKCLGKFYTLQREKEI